ncbi:unnamed protein product [Heterobilharzia americana]|nr:unnamed protein product [Heterobilharzia americana]CAH8663372.1 unnamed protein product [Heterobilharzia americana]
MKRSKRRVDQSPSSSTPVVPRRNLELSPLFSYGIRDSDTDNSAEHFGLPVSPPSSKPRFSSIRYSPLEIDAQPNKENVSSIYHNFSQDTSSPDGGVCHPDLSDRSIAKTFLSDHLQHSFSFARHMEQRALLWSTRIKQSVSLSMSPRLLFQPEACASSDAVDSASERKKLLAVDDLILQSYMTISRQTVSTVERYARLAVVCPELLSRRTVNRFMRQCTPGEECRQERPSGTNPIFNCSYLAGSFSNVVDICRTRLAVLYKARHRLSGVLYCLKRSRCDFELEHFNGSSSAEMLNEVQALSLLQHTNIIRFFGSWYEADSVYEQLELCLGGSLFHLLHPDRQHDTSEVVSFVSQTNHVDGEGHTSPSDTNGNRLSEKPLIILASHVLSALHYMHTNWSMVHGDVKPSNVLIQLSRPEAYLASAKDCIEMDAKCHCYKLLLAGDTTGIVFKLSDFGRASRAGEDRDGDDLGDGRYLPRLNDPSPPARAATGRDLYALGITLYHSAGGPMSASVWERLRETDCLPDLLVMPVSLRPVVKSLLRPLAQDRPTASELVNYPLFRPHVNIRSDDPCPLLDVGSSS